MHKVGRNRGLYLITGYSIFWGSADGPPDVEKGRLKAGFGWICAHIWGNSWLMNSRTGRQDMASARRKKDYPRTSATSCEIRGHRTSSRRWRKR